MKQTYYTATEIRVSVGKLGYELTKDYIADLLVERERRIQQKMAQILSDNNSVMNAVRTAAKACVCRDYNEVVKAIPSNVPIQVVWGTGGGQSVRVAEMQRNGIKFVRIPKELIK